MDRTGWIGFDWIEINWKLCLSPAAASAPAMVAPTAPVIKGRMKCSRTQLSNRHHQCYSGKIIHPLPQSLVPGRNVCSRNSNNWKWSRFPNPHEEAYTKEVLFIWIFPDQKHTSLTFSCESLFTAKCVSLSASSTFSFSFLLTLGSLVGTFLPLVPPLLVQFPTILVIAALAGKVPLCPPFQLTQDDQLAFYNPPNDSSWSLGPNKHQAAEFKCRSSKNHIKFL